MRHLKIEDFSGSVGQGFEVVVGGGSLVFRLEEAQPLPGSMRQGGGFRLIFRGAAQPVLPQGTYMFRNRGHADQIFVVPIGVDPNGTLYEAIFF